MGRGTCNNSLHTILFLPHPASHGHPLPHPASHGHPLPPPCRLSSDAQSPATPATARATGGLMPNRCRHRQGGRHRQRRPPPMGGNGRASRWGNPLNPATPKSPGTLQGPPRPPAPSHPCRTPPRTPWKAPLEPPGMSYYPSGGAAGLQGPLSVAEVALLRYSTPRFALRRVARPDVGGGEGNDPGQSEQPAGLRP